MFYIDILHRFMEAFTSFNKKKSYVYLLHSYSSFEIFWFSTIISVLFDLAAVQLKKYSACARSISLNELKVNFKWKHNYSAKYCIMDKRVQAYTTRKREALAPYRLLCSFIGTSLCQRSAIATKQLQCLRLDPFQSDTFVGNALSETQERLPPVKKDLETCSFR